MYDDVDAGCGADHPGALGPKSSRPPPTLEVGKVNPVWTALQIWPGGIPSFGSAVASFLLGKLAWMQTILFLSCLLLMTLLCFFLFWFQKTLVKPFDSI